MFIGHYGLGYIVKKRFSDIPLWLLFLSVQLLDIVAFILVFFGIEKAGYVANINPFFRNDLFLPYSHSLSGAFLLTASVYIICTVMKRRPWALVLSCCVLSHWFIDFIVHTPDLTIYFGRIKTGLGLWHYPYLSYVIEVLLVLSGWLFLRYKNIFSILLLFLIVGSFSGMFFGKEPDTIKDSQAMRTAIVLASNTLFFVIAYLSEQRQLKGDYPKQNR